MAPHIKCSPHKPNDLSSSPGTPAMGKEKTDHTVLSSDLHMRAMALAFPSSHPLHTHAHMCTHVCACAHTHNLKK